MAILGSIRKRPIFLVIIIGLALFAFVLSGVFDGNGSPSRNSVGSIYGEDISAEEFGRKLDGYKNQNSNSSLQSVNSAWDALVREKVYENQIEKAGIVIGEKDIWDYLINNPNVQNNPAYKNEAGLFDDSLFKSYVATLKSKKQGKLDWINTEKSIVKELQQTAYDNLMKSSLTASLKEGRQLYYSDNSSADIQFVYEPYNTVKDSIVKISDAEITAYVKSHVDDFKVEATREIEYVNFEIKPSKDDFKIIENDLLKIKNDFKDDDGTNVTGFTNTNNPKEFVSEFSDNNYVDKLYFAQDLMTGVYDSVSKLTKGSVYGPYKKDDTFKMIKYLGNKSEYSVKSSHILISYEGAERAKPTVTRTKDEAEKFAKDLLRKVTKTNFSTMAKANSDDSSASRGGSLGSWHKEGGNLIKEFSDYVLNNRVDKIGFVETIFGYHIIKVDESKTESGLDLAIVSVKVDPSDTTESNIYQQAETLVTELTAGKDMLELAKTNNYAVKKANNLTELSENVIGLGNQRDIVRWAFNKKSNKGDIKRFDLENAFTIVQLKNKYKKGLTSLAVARPKVVPILEKTKKAVIIKNKMNGTTLDEIAKSIGKSINSAEEVSLTKPNLKVGGNDENVAAALLYMNEGDVKLIEGKNGIYAVKVVKKTPLHDVKKYDTYANTITTQLKTKNQQVYNALKESSQIEDQRASIY